MKILITGGSGFIGLRLYKLLKNKFHVTIFDIRQPVESEVNFISGSIHDDQKLSESIQGKDIVIHLAAAVGVKNTETNPITTLDTNIIGTKKILENCAKHKIKKIIFSSSSEVYGEPKKIPTDELQTPIPITTYGISKLAGEEYVKTFAKTYNFKYSILRFFNAVGPGQSLQFVLSEFINNALNDKPISIHGTGLQIRAFCHVDDICQGIENSISKGDNELFNIGNDSEPISIENLAKKVKRILNSKSEIKFIPFNISGRSRKVEILSRVPNINKAKKLLSYEPQFDLERSVRSISASMKYLFDLKRLKEN